MTPNDRLNDWLAGLDAERAGDALLAIGIQGETHRSLASPLRIQWPLRRWALSGSFLREVLKGGLLPPAIGVEGRQLRLAIETDAIPDDVARRLLRSPYVGSAFVAAERPPGSLRRRPWRWPYRIGLLGFPEDADHELRSAILAFGQLPEQLVRIQRLEDEPAAVDLLIVDARLEDAVAEIIRQKPLANAILVLDEAAERWPLVNSQLAAARAATAAAASALAKPSSLAATLNQLLLESAHATPFDVALTHATGGDLLLVAEPSAMAEAAVPEVAVRVQAEASRSIEALGAETPAAVRAAPSELGQAVTGAFFGESHEASEIAEVTERVEEALDEAPQKRWVQANIGTDDVLSEGPNEVSVFIGPPEEDALRADAPLDESLLPWEEERAEAFRLTVLFAPLLPKGEVQQAELDLPRVGRSKNVQFNLVAPTMGEEVAVRILVLFRNRVLQTAVLGGPVGERGNLREVTALVPALHGLDDRRAFDAVLVANETNGIAALIAHSNGHTAFGEVPGLNVIMERLADQLATAAGTRSVNKGLRTEAARKFFIQLARDGHDFYDALGTRLEPLRSAERIQIVTAHSGWFLPLELCYPRYAPSADANVCGRYVEDPATCDGNCTPENDRKTICPNAFWGLSKTIERHHFSPGLDESASRYVVLAFDRPRSGKRDVVVKRLVLAASSRVKQTDRDATASALGATAADDWDEWCAALEAQDTDLLVLMPHAKYTKKASELEIGNKFLARAEIEQRYVTGAREDVHPAVILFGCRTTGKADDPAGFATRFMLKGARVVFHSSTDLLNIHATQLAQRLGSRLAKPPPQPQLLSEAVASFRREAIHEGLLAAFAITAYGDADWRI